MENLIKNNISPLILNKKEAYKNYIISIIFHYIVMEYFNNHYWQKNNQV